ncbi:Crp/Fnr family transcriptional regulator [Flavicella marina]|uniref:Crp/Fnr family transcriptional regulator n=1 Tax=Flavicella marina TaxID=1475951 RepID=UPI001D01AA84|nr:Crp/Fnr family transcriptional regulator [Flavicella marina]
MKDNIYDFLNNISSISEDTWLLLSANMVEIELKKGAYFVKEGEISKEIGFLTKGIVRSFYATEAGKEYNKTLFKAPNIVGSYVSLITGQPNRLPQQALTECIITKIPLVAIEKLSKNSVEIERLRRKIAEYFFVLKEKKELEMALLQAEDRYLIFRKEYPGVEQLIPQYHIASYLGVSATQLSRIRNKMSTEI